MPDAATQFPGAEAIGGAFEPGVGAAAVGLSSNRQHSMSITFRILLTIAVGIAACRLDAPRTAVADDRQKSPKPAIGDKIDTLRFVDLRYLTRTLDDFGKKNAYVVVMTNLDCPIVRRYLPRLKALDEQYRKHGVQFLSLNVGTEESIVDVAAQAVKADIAFPFCKDFQGTAARALGLTRTPEVAVLDAKKRLVYRGRIDGDIRFGGVRPKPSRADLKEALDDLLAKRKIRVSETPVDGCLITFPEIDRTLKRQITFSEHIAPLMQKHCQECHHPKTEAPFSLITYKDVSRHAKMIGEVVMQQRMPPWFGSSRHGTFTNRRGMTSAERQLIADWIRGGKLEGDPKKLPEPLKFPEVKWHIGTPDLVVKMATTQKIPADGYIPYRYAILPYVFLKDTWVEKVEILPGNRSVVHHCNLGYLRVAGGKPKPHFITGFVPGGAPMVLDKGTGFKIPAGSVLALQLHYVSVGEEATDRTSVGFVFPKGTVNKQIRHVQVNTSRFAIPPGAPHHRVVSERTIHREAVGIGMFSHMHLRGKDMTFRALYPDGKQETLLVIPNYSFDWQMPYRWEKGKKTFPKGTRIQVIAHYDNSTFNPYNPDPKKTVRYGPQTYHEMMFGFFFYLDRNEKLGLKIDPKTGHEIKTQKP
eukprot:g33081.t1